MIDLAAFQRNLPAGVAVPDCLRKLLEFQNRSREWYSGYFELTEWEVVLHEELHFLDLLEPCRQNLSGENFLPGADVVEHAGRALPLDAAKIDQDYLPAWSQRPVDRAQRLGGELEMMIGIADGENTTWK